METEKMLSQEMFNVSELLRSRDNIINDLRMQVWKLKQELAKKEEELEQIKNLTANICLRNIPE